jgi:hypothetical protein
MYKNVEPRAQSCTTCGQPSVHPRIMQVQRGKDVITEAHWVCPRCSNRFMTGTLNIQQAGEKKQN